MQKERKWTSSSNYCYIYSHPDPSRIYCFSSISHDQPSGLLFQNRLELLAPKSEPGSIYICYSPFASCFWYTISSCTLLDLFHLILWCFIILAALICFFDRIGGVYIDAAYVYAAGNIRRLQNYPRAAASSILQVAVVLSAIICT